MEKDMNFFEASRRRHLAARQSNRNGGRIPADSRPLAASSRDGMRTAFDRFRSVFDAAYPAAQPVASAAAAEPDPVLGARSGGSGGVGADPMPASGPASPLQRLRARASLADDDDGAGVDRLISAQTPWEPDDGSDADTIGYMSLEGVVSEVRQYGEWGAALLTLPDRQQWRLTGESVALLKDGLSYRVSGTVKQHPQHGESFDVALATPVVEADEGALQRYLVKRFDGVGQKRARQYIAALVQADPRLLTELSQVLVHEPWALDVQAVLNARARVRFVAEQAELFLQDGEDKEGEGEPENGADPAHLAKIQQAQHKAALESLARSFMLSFARGDQFFKEAQARALAEYFWGRFGPDPDLLNKSMASLKEDPYEPVLSVEGYGFATADALGKRMGIVPDDEKRLRVAGAWVVQQACLRRGHGFLSTKEFVTDLKRTMPGVSPQKVLNACAAKQTLVIEPQEGRISTPKLWTAQQRVAMKVADRLRSSAPLTSKSYDEVTRFLRTKAHRINERFANGGLDDAQIHAVAAIMTAPATLHVLTGGPGTGKTTIMECVAWMLRRRKSFLFAAPTGKAARVLSSRLSALNVNASTICSMLRGTDDAGYEINAEKPLEADVLVIDESTMVGIETADALLQAARPDTHIIFLGDPGTVDNQGAPDKSGQLPSIAPGRFMHDLQAIPEVQKLHLTRVFRNAGGILDVVREVADGNIDIRDRETVKFESLPDPKDALETVIARYLELSRRDGAAHTALIMPRRAGSVSEPGWNVTWSNAILRDILNKNGIKMPGTIYRLGDRVIIRQNLQVQVPSSKDLDGRATTLDAGRMAQAAGIEEPQSMMVYREDDPEAVKQVRLVNGDTGSILGWRMDADNPRMGQPRWVELLLDDGRRVWLPGDEIGVLDHAYALTVHAVQGSEYRNVLFCATDGGENFMNANMLLTALSRAKNWLQVWGDRSVLRRVAATKLPDRNSSVAQNTGIYLASSNRAISHAQDASFEEISSDSDGMAIKNF